MAKLKCPTCGQRFEPAESSAVPFCSPRCRTIDLGRWLNEAQKVPVLRRDGEDEEDGGQDGGA